MVLSFESLLSYDSGPINLPQQKFKIVCVSQSYKLNPLFKKILMIIYILCTIVNLIEIYNTIFLNKIHLFC